MPGREKPLRHLIHEFFGYFPDYRFCQTLALNIEEGTTTYQGAVEILIKKARAAEQNRDEIRAKLDRRTVDVRGTAIPIRDLSLREILRQDDEVIREIALFYFKHPYAHNRTGRTRLLPRWCRTLFLSALLGHCRKRNLDMDYDVYFDTLTLL